tara:strand:- start:2153 stop:3400 length:1248 start_codon:yes stop_codon:yes gene_type:complete
MTKNAPTLFLIAIGIFTGFGQVGQFETALDIGDPAIKGSSTYDKTSQSYTLKGGGENIWFNHDEFHFLFKKIKGDFILTANFELIGNEDGNGHRKTGWMIRESTDHDAVSINSCMHGDGLAVLQWRLMRGAYMRDPEEEIFFPKQYFGETIIQLERIGKTITMRLAQPGEPLEEMGSTTLPELKDEVLVGPYALAHDPSDTQEARVWNVRITKPLAPDWHPNPLVETISHEVLQMPSNIEIIELDSRKRKVIHRSDGRLQAPYFSGEGDKVMFGEGNKTFELPAMGGSITEVTASGKRKSNKKRKYDYYIKAGGGTNQVWRKKSDGTEDRQMTYDLDHAWFPHVSPDGKWVAYLAFPHDSNPASPGRYQSVNLKLLPTDGGSAKSIAYFYGGKGSFENYAWHPDSKSLVFVSHED